MRIVLATLFVLVLAVPAAAFASERPLAGSLSIEEGAGVITLKGQGGVIGKLDGVLQIVDLTPRDRWRPIVNGDVVKKPRVRVRGESISFRLLGGKFKLVIKGEAVSISARGRGVAVLKGDPDVFGYAGLYSTDADIDCIGLPDACEIVPGFATKIEYGLPPGRDKQRAEEKETSDKSANRPERGASS